VVLSQLQSQNCVTEIVPVNDNLGRPHTTNKPYNHKGRNARWVLPHSQRNWVCVSEKNPNLCNYKLGCGGNCEQEGKKDGQNLVYYLYGGDDQKRQTREKLRELSEVKKLDMRN
jgi:hypothetical protein